MKKTNLFKNSLWALAAFLFATVMLGFSACSEMDNPAGQSDPASSGVFDVTGMWYAETVAKGTIGEGEEAQEYTKVVQICEFQDGEDGLWVQYFINSDGDVIQLPGGIYIGQFIYSTHADGTIVFDITGEYGEVELVDTWTMKYADGHITGLVGSQVQDMAPATAAEKDQIKKWGLQIGLGGSDDTSYNINSDAEALKAVNKEAFTKANWRTQSSIYCWTRENIREDNIKDSNGGTGYYSVMLPWSSSGSTGTLPVDFCSEMVKDNNWNLVMNYCGRRYPSDANYMAFYHAYTGKLRIFYYIPEHAESGASDHFFQVLMPNAVAEHSPFGYGIPINGTMKNPRLIGANVNDANYLTQYITPYSSADSPMGNIKPTAGWYAFDIDLSLLRNNNFDASSKPFQFKSRCLNKSLASFYGTQVGSIDGSINLESCSASSTGGIFGPLEDVLGQVNGIKDFIGGAAKVYSDVMSGDILGAIEGGISVAKQGCDLVGIDYGNETEGFNGYKGDVNLKLSTQIDLKGQITQETVMKGLTDLQAPMGYFDFDQTHLGEGVWNIVDHPVVYYTNAQIAWREEYAYSHIMGDGDEINRVLWVNGKSPFGANKKKVGKNSDINNRPSYTISSDPWCGYVTYFDPSNIKVKLNPNLFTPEEIQNAQVYATCGVRKATSAFGSLDSHRAAFGLQGSKFGISMKNGGDYYNRPFDEAPYDALYNSENAAKLSGMKTGVTFPATKYDGYKCGMFGRGDDSYILMPQSLSGSDHPLMTYMPSYEVTVTVIVKHNGKPIVYSRSYLPEYVKMDVADMPFYSDQQISSKRPANYVADIYKEQMKHINDIYLWTRRTLQGVEGNTLLASGDHAFDWDYYDKYSESWPCLIDGNKNTKWCTTKKARRSPVNNDIIPRPRDDNESWYAVFKTNYGVSPTGYTFVNGGDTQVFTERRPRVWYIWGKKEEKDNWTKLAYEYTSNSDGTAKSSAMPNGNYAEKSYKFNQGVAKDFKYFLIDILSNWSDDSDSKMQLSEFRFTYDD